MKKLLREQIWNKYNKCCAYCGNDLLYKNMQVDHKVPKSRGGSDNKNNLMPTCRRCNHYKRARSLERFRELLITLHERVQNDYVNKVGIDYGIISINPFDGIFYFEKTKEK